MFQASVPNLPLFGSKKPRRCVPPAQRQRPGHAGAIRLCPGDGKSAGEWWMATPKYPCANLTEDIP